jgi:hypothetical protein
MALKFYYSLLFVFLLPFLFSCNKEYSLEGNAAGGSAIFTYSGSPDACTDAVVTGNYQAGNTLDLNNKVTLSVNVSIIGNYSITTNTVNGISFSGSGSFTTPGIQTIVLTGSGVPIAGGTFDISPGVNGCDFPVDITGTAVYSLNESSGNCSSFSISGSYAAGTALTATEFATVSVTISAIGAYTISTERINGISFSASGIFTSPGIQIVQLNGLGTPLAAGTFSYTPGIASCSISVAP